LLDNACKFTHDGAVRLRVCAGNGVLSIEVVDSGIGIPQDQLKLIFEPFRQVDMSDTRRYGGTGLGLAITKNVCQLLGGAIAVDSTPGVGSRFRVEIPLPIR
jgi:signal transduction histidine kinase